MSHDLWCGYSYRKVSWDCPFPWLPSPHAAFTRILYTLHSCSMVWCGLCLQTLYSWGVEWVETEIYSDFVCCVHLWVQLWVHLWVQLALCCRHVTKVAKLWPQLYIWQQSIILHWAGEVLKTTQSLRYRQAVCSNYCNYWPSAHMTPAETITIVPILGIGKLPILHHSILNYTRDSNVTHMTS